MEIKQIISVGLIALSTILLCGTATATEGRRGAGLRGNNRARQLNVGGACKGCWPGTSGPCKSAHGVCYAYFVGTTMCPPGSTECAASAPLQAAPKELKEEAVAAPKQASLPEKADEKEENNENVDESSPTSRCEEGSSGAVGAVLGDPHIYTFDGLTNDCQAAGEFILLKSKVTTRQIQARFAHFTDDGHWSVTKSVVVQDEGNSKKVQINVPVRETSSAPNKIGSCPVQFFVDGVQRNMKDGSEDDKVQITNEGAQATILFADTGFKVTVKTAYANGCFLNLAVNLPCQDNSLIGLMGTPNGNPLDDWMEQDGTPLNVPTTYGARSSEEGYKYCATHWCIRNEAQSLYTHNEKGVDFFRFMQCDLPFGGTFIEDIAKNAPPAVLDLCGEDPICIVDGVMGGLRAAKAALEVRLAVAETCNEVGGECEVADCCGGLACTAVDDGAKECVEPVKCQSCHPGTAGPCKSEANKVCWELLADGTCPAGTSLCQATDNDGNEKLGPTPRKECIDCDKRACKNTQELEGEDEGCPESHSICVDDQGYQIVGYGVSGVACVPCTNTYRYNDPHIDQGCTANAPYCVFKDMKEPEIRYAGHMCVSALPEVSKDSETPTGDTSGQGNGGEEGQSETSADNEEDSKVQGPLPKADRINHPVTVVMEDQVGTLAFGADISSMGHKILKDAKESITEIKIEVPPNTDSMSYAISGPYIPSWRGFFAGVKSAQVSFQQENGKRTYSISSSLLSDSPVLATKEEREQAEADILSTVETFKLDFNRPQHDDSDGSMVVTITNVEVLNGQSDSRETSFNPILVKAIADEPGIQVTHKTRIGVEDDGEVMPLQIVASASEDIDGSETTSVRIVVPHDSAGPIGNITSGSFVPTSTVSLIDQGEGTYLVTSRDLPSLNQFLDGNVVYDPRPNFAGTFSLRVDVISTEAANGKQVKRKKATVTDYIDIVVKPVLDATIVEIKGNAVGKEDTRIKVPISITLGDPDGSEVYTTFIESSNLPEGTTLYGANGAALVPSSETGQYILSAVDVDVLAMLPPLHWSSPVQGDITLLTATKTTETGLSEFSSLPLEIPIKITGVADKPSARSIHVTGTEDQPYDLGAAVLASGPLREILVDQDGSETFYLLIEGLPGGIIPSSSVGEINYLGKNKYQIDEAAISTLMLPPQKHYSGEKPYPGLKIRATSQEVDGNQVNSNWWSVTFAINPVVDGFGGWTSRVRASEGTLETNDQALVKFSSVSGLRFVDLDGSESVLKYEFDFSRMVEDAGIGVHIVENLHIHSLRELVNAYLEGTYEFNELTGVATVLRGDIGGFALRPQLFLDSNQDFRIPAKVTIRDRAVIHGAFVDSIGTDTGIFYVHLSGTADVPTAFSSSTGGSARERIGLYIGGKTTDTDVALGRTRSEFMYFVVQYLNPGPDRSRWALMDGRGNVVGSNTGAWTWILYESDLADIRLYAPISGAENQTMCFKLIAIARENDNGHTASNTSYFDVDVRDGHISGEDEVERPLPPILEVVDHVADEDKVVALKANARADPNDITNPKVTLVISDIPDGAEIAGATLDPVTAKYIASMEAIEAGFVRITPPRDFSGTMYLTLEAIATNSQAYTTSSGERAVSFIYDPVVDGVGIVFSALKADNKPLDPEKWVAPATGFELKLRGRCSSSGHTERLKKCVLACPIHDTPVVPFGQEGPFRFTSQKPSDTSFELPEGLALRRGKGQCDVHDSLSDRMGRNVIWCGLEDTTKSYTGFDGHLRFSNEDGESLIAMGVLWWAHSGRNIFFYHDDVNEVNRVFPPSSTINVEHHFTAAGGETFNIESVMHWAWSSMQTYFYVDPIEYSAQTCDDAAAEFNAMFQVQYSIGVEIFGEPVVKEDQDFVLTLGLNELDVDGSETIGEWTYMKMDSGANWVHHFPVVSETDDDSSIHGTSVVGYSRIPSSKIGDLFVRPARHWHGEITIDVVTTALEPLDDEDGDHMKVQKGSKKITVIPIADRPNVQVPESPIEGVEDTSILIGTDLAVSLVDTVKTNGAESLSVVLSGVPKDSILSVGSNNGDGSWSIPVSDISKLKLTPPPNYAGFMTLTLTGIAVELSRGYSEASTSKEFGVVVAPVADSFLMLAKNLESFGGGSTTSEALLTLNIRMEDNRGTLDDEVSPERLSLTFSNVPDGLRLWPQQGGTVLDRGEGKIEFVGSEIEAQNLMLVRSGSALKVPADEEEAYQYTISIEGVTSDAGVLLAEPVEDNFVLRVVDATHEDTEFVPGIELKDKQVLQGSMGNDILIGTAGNDTIQGDEGHDTIQGGAGFDVLTGGAGMDWFQWSLDDLDGVDTITDFDLGLGGDILDVTGIVSVIDWDAPSTIDPIPAPINVIEQYMKLQQVGNSTMVLVDTSATGTNFVPMVVLEGITDLSLADLVDGGNIMI